MSSVVLRIYSVRPKNGDEWFGIEEVRDHGDWTSLHPIMTGEHKLKFLSFTNRLDAEHALAHYRAIQGQPL